MKHIKGFTLVELLVVIAIVGILAAIIITNFGSANKFARDAVRRAEMDQIKKALMLGIDTETESFPIQSEWCCLGSVGVDSCENSTNDFFINKLIIPKDPLNSSSQDFCYKYKSINGQSFQLCNNLEGADKKLFVDSSINYGLKEVSNSVDCGTSTTGNTCPSGDTLGTTWNLLTYPSYTQKPLISDNGQYQMIQAVSWNEGLTMTYISDDYGATWRDEDNGQGYSDMFMSSDGRYRTKVSGYSVLVSNDFGATFTSTGIHNFTQIAGSLNGQYQLLASVFYSSDVKISNDYGVTWNTVTLPEDNSIDKISGNGKYQFAFGRSTDNVYRSTDFGVTWNKADDLAGARAVYASQDGKYQSFSYWNTDLTAKIIATSNDYGATWTRTNNMDLMAMSRDGKNQVAKNANDLYISNDYGVTWNIKSNAMQWSQSSVSMSDNGKYFTATIGDGTNPSTLLTSEDCGSTWTQRDATYPWGNSIMTPDGKYRIVLSQSNFYTSDH